MAPGQKCHKLWHYFRLWPGFGQTSHIFEVAGTEAFDAGEFNPQIVGQPFDDPGAPALGSLPDEDLAPDGPVEKDQFPADSECGAGLGGVDAPLEIGQKVRIAGRQRDDCSFRNYLA